MTTTNNTANTINNDTIIITDTTIFTDIKALYEDMTSNYQSFIKYENVLNATGKKAVILGETIYRHVEIKRGKLEFHGNKFGGSELCINGKIERAEKIGAENSVSEYRIYIEELEKPLVLMAVKSR